MEMKSMKRTMKTSKKRVKKKKSINNPALKDGVCCSGKVFVSGFNTFKSALKGGVLNPSYTIKTCKKMQISPWKSGFFEKTRYVVIQGEVKKLGV